jgi:hypothetical protein
MRSKIRHPLLWLPVLILANALHADDPVRDPVIALASNNATPSLVAITVPAQYLVAEIDLSFHENDWDLREAAIKTTRDTLATLAKQNGCKLEFQQPLSYQKNYDKFYLSSSSGNPQLRETLSDVLLLAPINEQTDLRQIVRRFQTLTLAANFPPKVSVKLDRFRLAVEDPESFRPELLKKIKAHVEDTAKILTRPGAHALTTDYRITGIDGPVQVRPKGERELELFLPFSATYEREK